MIKDRLLNLPNEIFEKKCHLIDKQQELEDIKMELKIWEMKEMNTITNLIDEKGKPYYSNAEKRAVALQDAKDKSDFYDSKSIKAKILEKEIAVINIQLDKLFNEQGNLRAICRLEGDAN